MTSTIQSTSHIPTLGKFEPLTEDEVAKIIMGMASMSCESDLVPTILLKEILPQVIRPITEIINTSLVFGIFSIQWKVTLIKPLLKEDRSGPGCANLLSCQQPALPQQGP